MVERLQTIPAKQDGVGAAYQLWILRGAKSGSQPRIGVTERGSLRVQIKSDCVCDAGSGDSAPVGL